MNLNNKDNSDDFLKQTIAGTRSYVLDRSAEEKKASADLMNEQRFFVMLSRVGLGILIGFIIGILFGVWISYSYILPNFRTR